MNGGVEDQLKALTPNPQTGTRLVNRADSRQVFLDYRETDTRTALTRGLAEYLETLAIDWPGGRQSRFVRVFQTWSEPESIAEYPSAVVYATDAAEYQDSVLTPTLIQIPNTNKYLREVAELKLSLTVEVWATDPRERMALTAMVEDALDPHEFMTGLRLELPHYYNQRATFEKMSMSYEDAPESAQRRWRKSIFRVDGHITQLRRVGVLPMMDLRLDVQTDVDCNLDSV